MKGGGGVGGEGGTWIYHLFFSKQRVVFFDVCVYVCVCVCMHNGRGLLECRCFIYGGGEWMELCLHFGIQEEKRTNNRGVSASEVGSGAQRSISAWGKNSAAAAISCYSPFFSGDSGDFNARSSNVRISCVQNAQTGEIRKGGEVGQILQATAQKETMSQKNAVMSTCLQKLSA